MAEQDDLAEPPPDVLLEVLDAYSGHANSKLKAAQEEITELQKSFRTSVWIIIVLFFLLIVASSSDYAELDEPREKLSTILDRWEAGAPVSEIKEELGELEQMMQPPEPDHDGPY